jgi:hypothetical protein
VSESVIIVNKGSGVQLLKATVITKDWQIEECPFRVHVILSEHPHESKWKYLASDMYELQFQQ